MAKHNLKDTRGAWQRISAIRCNDKHNVQGTVTESNGCNPNFWKLRVFITLFKLFEAIWTDLVTEHACKHFLNLRIHNHFSGFLQGIKNIKGPLVIIAKIKALNVKAFNLITTGSKALLCKMCHCSQLHAEKIILLLLQTFKHKHFCETVWRSNSFRNKSVCK